MSFENQLAGQIYQQNQEKSYMDKILSSKDVKEIRDIIKKPKLSRSDISELLYLISSNEAKLYNFDSWHRYVILKMFVWIREFIKVFELLFDYIEDLERMENTCKECTGFIDEEHRKKEGLKDKQDKCVCIPDSITGKIERKVELTPRTKQLLDNCERLIQHNVKFLIDLYLNICRTSLSLGATGLLELIKNKFEFAYNQNTNQPKPESKGVFK